MRLNKKEIIDIVNNQLAIDLSCNKEDFRKDGVIYYEPVNTENQRKYIKEKPYIEMVTMGQLCIISVDNEIRNKVKKVLEGKSRNEIDGTRIMTESEIHYIPDIDRIVKKELPKEFEYEIKEGKEEVEKLYKVPGFDNSIQYGENYVGPDEIVLYAKDKDEIIAMAGASKDTETMWQIGCDVKEDYRSKGLATALVSNLANIILDKGKLPYYSTTSSNIPSQLVAYKCGFMPYWYSTKKINKEIIK